MGHSVILCNTELESRKALDYLVNCNIKCNRCSARSSYYTFKPSPVPFVKVNDKLAVFSAIKYLTEKGHRKIAIVSGGET